MNNKQMSMPMTHIDDGYLMDHATGAAPKAIQVLTACQVSMRPETADRLNLVENALGALFESSDVAVVEPDMMATVLSKIDSLDVDVTNTLDQDTDRDIPAPLKPYIPTDLEDLPWKRHLGGPDEIRLKELSEAGVEVSLLRLRPGMSIPDHDHEHEEITLVLTGGFSDHRGEYVRGDVCMAGPGVMHRPHVSDDEDCICLAVSLGSMRFKNPLHGMVHRLSRMAFIKELQSS